LSSSLLALFARSTHAPAQVRYSRSLDITLLSPISHCIAINREPRFRSAKTQILSKSSIKVRLTLKSLSSCSAFTCIKSVVASVAELRSGSSALHLSQRARQFARLLSCKAAMISFIGSSRSLICRARKASSPRPGPLQAAQRWYLEADFRPRHGHRGVAAEPWPWKV
jgi:hypothetical protein